MEANGCGTAVVLLARHGLCHAGAAPAILEHAGNVAHMCTKALCMLLPMVQAAAGPALFGAGGRGAAVALLADVAALLALGRAAAVRALEDLRRLLQLALVATLQPGPCPAAPHWGPPTSAAAAQRGAGAGPASGAVNATLQPVLCSAAASQAPRGAECGPASGTRDDVDPSSGGAGSSAPVAGAPGEAAPSTRVLTARAGFGGTTAARPPDALAAGAPGSGVAAVERLPEAAARDPASRASNLRPRARGRRRLQAAELKLRFFLAWANEAPGAMYRALAEDVRGELARHSEGLAQGAGSEAGDARRSAGVAALAEDARRAAPGAERGPGRGAAARRRTLVQEL